MADKLTVQCPGWGSIEITADGDDRLLIIVNDDANGASLDRAALKQVRDHLTKWLGDGE